jgi:hypothetical protein
MLNKDLSKVTLIYTKKINIFNWKTKNSYVIMDAFIVKCGDFLNPFNRLLFFLTFGLKLFSSLQNKYWNRM